MARGDAPPLAAHAHAHACLHAEHAARSDQQLQHMRIDHSLAQARAQAHVRVY